MHTQMHAHARTQVCLQACEEGKRAAQGEGGHTSTTCTASSMATEQLEQLRAQARAVDSELASEVTSHSKQLFGHVQHVLDAEGALADVVLSVESLQSAVRRIRAEVAGPYGHIKARTSQLVRRAGGGAGGSGAGAV